MHFIEKIMQDAYIWNDYSNQCINNILKQKGYKVCSKALVGVKYRV